MEIESKIESYIASVQKKYKVHINVDFNGFMIICTVYKERHFSDFDIASFGINRCYELFGEPLFKYEADKSFARYDLKDEFFLHQFDVAFKTQMIEKIMKEYVRSEE